MTSELFHKVFLIELRDDWSKNFSLVHKNKNIGYLL